MTDTHAEARKALAKISTIPDGNSPNGVVCTNYEQGQSIADLVAEQDAQIAAIRDALEACHFYLREHYNNVMDGDEEYHLIQSAKSTLNATTEAAKAYEARIVAETIERCAKVADGWPDQYGFKSIGDKKRFDHNDVQRAASAACRMIGEDIRAMGGKADE